MRETHAFFGLNFKTLLFSAAVFIVGLIIYRRLRGPESMRDTVVAVVCFSVLPYAAVLVWNLLLAPYLVYRDQATAISSLQRTAQNRPLLNLRIGGVVVMGIDADSTRLQLTVMVTNGGVPTTVHDWRLVLRTASGEIQTFQMIGEEPAKGSLRLPPLNERLQQAIGTYGEVSGLLDFRVPKIPQEHITAVMRESHTTLALSVRDGTNNEEWRTERSTMEMAAERFEQRKAK